MDWSGTPTSNSERPAHSFEFQQTSPLATLVRQTSSHRRAGELLITPPSQLTAFVTTQPPPSPLLHSHFRGSTVTSYSKDYSSYLDTSESTFVEGADTEYHYYDRESVYSNITALLPSPTIESPQPSNGLNEDAASSSSNRPTADRSPVLPAVLISTPDSSNFSSIQGKAAIVAPTTANFSWPVRRPSPTSDDQKRQVLERNARRSAWPSSPSISQRNQSSASPNSNRTDFPLSSNYRNHAPQSANPIPLSTPSLVISSPPSQISPAASVYPKDSLYRRDNTSSPLSRAIPLSGYDAKQTQSVTKHPLAIPPAQSLQTAYDYLLLGIQHHEANRLKDSASCFEMSAKQQGGCGVGMLMWGLTLRHGWGCQRNEKQAFKWLQKAAESAVGDLESARGGMEASAVQTELVLAIHEVGRCFFHGWGVAKDRVMAVSYYTVAARLGDADAQQDLAFCLANGKGCKKDKREAAKWHRAAVAQGASDVGLAWIYKEKYQ